MSHTAPAPWYLQRQWQHTRQERCWRVFKVGTSVQCAFVVTVATHHCVRCLHACSPAQARVCLSTGTHMNITVPPTQPQQRTIVVWPTCTNILCKWNPPQQSMKQHVKNSMKGQHACALTRHASSCHKGRNAMQAQKHAKRKSIMTPHPGSWASWSPQRPCCHHWLAPAATAAAGSPRSSCCCCCSCCCCSATS
jgi:hypothetical protein